MYSVTQRISKIKQPRGGYIKRKDFTCITLEDGIELNSQENIHPSLIGLVIDYMTRFCMGTPKETAFHISILGAKIAKNEFVAYKLLSKINGLDTESIISASKLVGYDVCYRAGMAYFKPVSEITPDMNTITNIITMIKRTLSFWEQYGPIIKDGFTFEGGYTSIISAGDGDYLTKDTLWDLKVLKEEIKPKYTLQLLIYLIMGQHSVHKEFKNITQLGIYNPRLNKVYTLLGVTVSIKKRSQQFIHALLTSYTTYFNCLPHPSESDILESSHFPFYKPEHHKSSTVTFPFDTLFKKRSNSST